MNKTNLAADRFLEEHESRAIGSGLVFAFFFAPLLGLIAGALFSSTVAMGIAFCAGEAVAALVIAAGVKRRLDRIRSSTE